MTLHRFYRAWGGGLILLSLAFLAPHCGCYRYASPEAAEAAYTAELLRCTDRAATLEESLACEREVDARWGVDGGAR